MKSTVFARPNLKAFLLAAVLIAVVQNFIGNGNSQASSVHARSLTKAETNPATELQLLLQQAENAPTSDLYTRISRLYEKQGDVRKALIYLRRAQVVAQSEEAD